MKRISGFSLFVALILLVSVSFGAQDYTLPEKMEKQLSVGSGVIGSFILQIEGNGETAQKLIPLSGKEFQFNGIRSDGESLYTLYQKGANKEQIGLTEIYFDEKIGYLKSNFIPETTWSFPMIDELLDRLVPVGSDNTSAASAVWRALGMSEEEKTRKWNPVIEKYSNKLELWLAAYAIPSTVKTEDGSTAIKFVFQIPMKEFKDQIITFVQELIADPDAGSLLDSIFSEEQKQLFFNSYLDYYYLDALNSLNNDFDIIITRVSTGTGKEISQTIEFPLDEKYVYFSSLKIEEDQNGIAYHLSSQDKSVTMYQEKNPDDQASDIQSFWLSVKPAASSPDNTKYYSVRIDVTKKTETYTDEDFKSFHSSVISLNIVRDTSKISEGENDSDYSEVFPIHLNTELRYSSKYAQSSPVYLDFSGSFSCENFSLSINGNLKTASPWTFTPMNPEKPQDILTASEKELLTYLNRLIDEADRQLTETVPIQESGSEFLQEHSSEQQPEKISGPVSTPEKDNAEGNKEE